MPKPNLSKILSANVIQSPQDDERFGLDWTKVKLGETVIQLDTKEVFIVVNLDELDNPNGYLNLTTSALGVTDVAGTAGEVVVTTVGTIATVSLANPLVLTGKTVTNGTFNAPTINTPIVAGGTFAGGTFNGPTINNAVMVAPALGTPVSGVATNLTGIANGLTAGNVVTNANLTGDVTSNGNATTLATVNGAPGIFGSSTLIPVITVNAKGLVTLITTVAIPASQPPGNYITALTGDVTAAGPGSVAATLATVNGSPGTFGSASLVPIITVNAKGLITSVTTQAVSVNANNLGGTTLASSVVNASLNNITPTGGMFNINGGIQLNAALFALSTSGFHRVYGLPSGFQVMDSTGSGVIATFTPSNLQVNGAIYGTSLVMVGNQINEYITNAQTAIALNYAGYALGTTQFRDLDIYNGKNVKIANFANAGLTVFGGVNATAVSSGALTVTNATGSINLVSTTGTQQVYVALTNGAGTYYAGVDNSAGNAFGFFPYDYGIFVPATRGVSTLIGGIGIVTRVNGSGLFVTGVIQGSRGLYADGALSSSKLSAVSLDQLNSTTSRLLAWGSAPNAQGTLQIGVVSSDASLNTAILTLSATNITLGAGVTSPFSITSPLFYANSSGSGLRWGTQADGGTGQLAWIGTSDVFLDFLGTLSIRRLTGGTNAVMIMNANGVTVPTTVKQGNNIVTGGIPIYDSPTGGLYLAFAGGMGILQGVADNSANPAPISFRVGNSVEIARVIATGLSVFGEVIAVSGSSTGFAAFRSGFPGATKTGIDLADTNDSAGVAYAVFRNSGAGVTGSINRVGITNAVAYNTSSDARLKENVRDFTGEDSGKLIDGLQPRWFDWKDGNGSDVVGFLAQEEHAVDPVFARIGAVTVGDANPFDIEKRWQRSDAALVPILVAELKSVRTRLQLLEATGRN